MSTVKTIVVKLGSSTVADQHGRLRRALLGRRLAEVAVLSAEGHRLVIVSSGAIACGQNRLGMSERPRQIAALQAASAIGQGRLFAAYAHLLQSHGLTAAQVLLTSRDFAERGSYVNARNTLRRLLSWQIVPVINENDTTATDEIRFGDNDVLAAQVAIMLRADQLVLLTDRDGLYTADPDLDATAQLIARVDNVADLAGADLRANSRRGAGGMRGKVTAALMAAAADVSTVIANGGQDGVLTTAAHDGGVGTVVPPRPVAMSAFKLWLRYAKPVRGTLEVDAGAARALALGGSSLLPVGVTAVHGSFVVGDAVAIVDAQRREIARGLTAMDARELRRVVGLHSHELRAVLPQAEEEVVHRDSLVLVDEEVR